MSTATITSKGQITIPAQVRASMGLDVGDRIEFVALDDGKYAIMAATHSVTDLKGLVRRPGKVVSIDDMNDAIAAQGAKAL